MSEKKSFEERVNDRALLELTAVDMDQLYDDMLDECNPDIKIGNIAFSACRILSELDPTAYRCGYSDFTDSVSDQYLEMSDGQYYNVDEIDTIRSEVEDEIEEEENQEGE